MVWGAAFGAAWGTAFGGEASEPEAPPPITIYPPPLTYRTTTAYMQGSRRATHLRRLLRDDRELIGMAPQLLEWITADES